MYLKVCKNHPDAKLPARSNPSDAGADVFYCGEETINLGPGTNYLFDTGLSIEVPHGYAVQVLNRSSMAAKRGLVVGACLLDPGYSGPVKIDLHNIGVPGVPRYLNSVSDGKFTAFYQSLCDQTIKPGDKIAQLVCYPIVHFIPMEVPREGLYSDLQVISNRDSGGFGSTGG